MTRRATRILLEVVAGLLGLVLLVSAFAAWRMSQGPVALDFLAPRVEQAMGSGEDGIQVRIGKTELIWAGWERKLDLRAQNIWIRNAEQVTVARFPEVEFKLSLDALLNGIFIPAEVTVTGATLRFVRQPDGALQFLGSKSADAEQETGQGTVISRLSPQVLERIISKPNPDYPLSYLKQVRIRQARVSVDDFRLQRVWSAPWADITLRSRDGLLTGNAVLQVEFAGDLSSVFTRLEFDPLRSEIGVNVDLGGVPLGPLIEDFQKRAELPAERDAAGGTGAEIMEGAPTAEPADAEPEKNAPGEEAEDLLAPFVSLDLSLFGSLDLTLNLEGKLTNALFDLSSSVGTLTLPSLLPEALTMRDLRLSGEMDTSTRILSVKTGSLSLARGTVPGPHLNFSAEAVGLDMDELPPEREFLSGDLEISARLALQNLPLSEFAFYWPEAFARAGQNWVVENIPSGLVRTAQADVKLSLPAGLPRKPELLDIYCQIAYEDMEIHYLRPLPEIRGVTGTAELTPKGMTFQAEGGQVEGGLSLSQSHVVISGFDQEDQAIAIDSLIEGPLPAALAIIDHERLDLLSDFGIDPARSGGDAKGSLHFDFPLLKDLEFSHVNLAVQAEVADAAVQDLVLGQDLSEGTLKLDVTQDAMNLTGDGRLGGVPVEDVVWLENFVASDPLEREITALVPRMTVAELGSFGLDLDDFLDESFAGKLRYRSESGGRSDIFVEAEVTATELRVDPLPWVKPVGEKGSARLHVGLQDNEARQLHDLKIDSEILSLQASGEFEPQGKGFRRLEAPYVNFAQNRLQDVTLRWTGPDLAIGASGGTFDMGLLLSSQEDDEGEEASSEEAEADDFTGRLHIRAPKLSRVYFGEDRYFDDVSVELLRGSRGWEMAAIDATIPLAFATPREKNLALDPDSPDTRSVSVLFRHNLAEPDDLTVLTHDAGGMLRALDWFDTLSGGRLVVTGDSEAPLPRGPLKMVIEVQNFAAEDVPALARLFTLASLSGPSDMLYGQGLSFERLIGQVSLAEHLLKTDLIRAYGSNVGLTATGNADLDALKLDVQGTLIPAYTINRFIEQIPLIGTLLTGGEGEGVIALTYTMKGDLTEPVIEVNPLSALAPGFLRGLFQASNPNEDDDDLSDGEESVRQLILPQRDK